MIAETLQQGFAEANRRFGAVFLDLLWKGIWFAITLGLLVLGFAWFSEQLRAVGWDSTGVRGLDSLVAGALLRQFWNANSGEFFRMLLWVAIASALIWLVLEAYFRNLILTPDPHARKFSVYLLSSISKWTIMGGAALALATIVFGRYLSTPFGEWAQLWVETRSAALVAVVLLAFLSFILALIETLVRSDAVELFGKDMLGVSGLIATLVAFETFIVAAAAIGLLSALLTVSRTAELIAVVGFAAAAIIVLSSLHSYLLLARFSAIGIMRRDVVDF